MSMLRSVIGKLYLRHKVLGLENCHGCGNATGYDHEPGCDMEICPRCDDQLISCDCHFVEAAYKSFEKDFQPNPFEKACEFANGKDVISITPHRRAGIIIVTVFYWKES